MKDSYMDQRDLNRMEIAGERALDTWGEDAQTTMAMEECAELITATSHYKRGRISDGTLAKEVADVAICIRQLEMMLGPRTMKDAYATGLDDLETQLDNAKSDNED